MLPIGIEEIWDQYHHRLRAFILSRVRDEAEADDLLQEVFVRIHLNLCCLRDLARLESWVYRIARHAIIDHYRRRKELVELPEELPYEDDYAEPEPGAEIAAGLREMVEALPSPYREALLLTEYQGLSQAELAAAQGISLSGAKSRVQRARQRLRDLLLACCHFELDRRGAIIEYHARCCCCNP